jgi:glycosyltransferase involved in cell wall biosynthesis
MPGRATTGSWGSSVGGRESTSGRARFLESGRVAVSTVAAYAWWAETAVLARVGLKGKRREVSRRTMLLLAPSFPPAVSGGTYRPLALARYGPGLGWDVAVTTDPPPRRIDPAGRHLLAGLPDRLTVTSVPRSWLRPSESWFPSVDGGFLTALATVRAGRQALGALPADVVVASGPSFHLFVAGYYLARASRCPLVLDYRDEWTECPFQFVTVGNADRAWERRCLLAADAVVFTTRSQLEHAAEAFGELDPSKCRVVPNGWEPSDWADAETDQPGQSTRAGQLTLSYVGRLADHVSPGGLLRALAAVCRRRPVIRERLRLRFVGEKSGAALEEVEAFPHPEKVELVDQLPRPAANRVMRESTALLLFNDARLARYIPGKLYEYLAARRPVIVFGEGGESAELVRKLGAGWIVPAADTEALGAVLDQLLRDPRPSGNAHDIERWLARHTRERLARDLIDLLELKVAGGRDRLMD